MITLLQYNASIVTPTDDAYLYNHIINDSGIFTGVEVTTQGGNIINVSDGRGIILGRNFVVEAQTINATLPTSGSVPGRLLIQIDMANTDFFCDTGARPASGAGAGGHQCKRYGLSAADSNFYGTADDGFRFAVCSAYHQPRYCCEL